MTALKGILRECVENPEDDAPRHVLADWLDDHGDADRAEFVRAQLAVARMDEDDPARVAVEARLKALDERHFSAWVRSLSRQVYSCSFWRGFLAVPVRVEDLPRLDPDAPGWDWVDRVTLIGTWTPRSLSQLSGSPLVSRPISLRLEEAELKLAGARALADFPWLANLRVLSLEKNNIGNKGVAALAASPFAANLRSLDLSHNRIGFEGVKALASSPHLANLVSLTLDFNSAGESGLAVLLNSPHLTRLESLSLAYNCQGTPRRLGALLGCDRPASLTHLNLFGDNLGPQGAAALVASPLLAKLTSLDLSANYIKPAGTRALAASPHLANLTSLKLYASMPGDEGVRALVRSPYLTNLTELDLSLAGWDITAAGVRELAAWSGLARLTRLTLNLDAEGAKVLVSSPRVRGLRDLSLGGGRLGDEGATFLAASPHLAGLLKLYLGRNGIGPAGAVALAKSESLAGLRRLSMGGNKIGKPAAAALRLRFGDRVKL